MPAQQMVDHVIDSGPGALLKEHGFKKKGRVFWRLNGEVFQTVYFLTSQSTSAHIGHFTLEVGSTVRYWHSVAHGLDVQRQITNFGPLVVRRFGPDLDHPIGQFWFLQTLGEAKLAVGEVIGRLTGHVFPFLDQYATEEDILAALDALPVQDSIDFRIMARALIRAHRGDVRPAIELLRQAKDKAVAGSSRIRHEHMEAYSQLIEKVEGHIQRIAQK